MTILPLLSQVPGAEKLSQEQIEQVTHRIQFGGDEVVKAKNGAGSATLSMAYAGARFALNLIEAAVKGTKDIVECTYISLEAAGAEATESVKAATGDDSLTYFSVPVVLGPNGVESALPIGSISDYEKKLFTACAPELKGNIVKGTSFV